MNKKLVIVLCGMALFVLLISCNLSNLFKKGGQQEEVQPPNEVQEQQEQQGQETQQPQEEPKVATPPPPSQPPQQEKPKTKTPPPKETPKELEQPQTTEEAEEVPPAGMGIIFVTNVRTGVFRVKMDDEKIIEHSFSGKKSGKAEEQRFTREIKFVPGEHKFKFVCEDNQGSRGVKELSLSLKPREHKVIKVTVKGAPGDMKLEILE